MCARYRRDPMVRTHQQEVAAQEAPQMVEEDPKPKKRRTKVDTSKLCSNPKHAPRF